MKTPREILLARHAAATPQLDALRHGAMNSLDRPCSRRRSRWWEKLWRELVVPCRPIWAGVGVAWVAILFLQLAMRSGPSEATARVTPVPSDLAAQVLAQQRLLSELLSNALPRNPAPAPKNGPPSGWLRPSLGREVRVAMV